MILGSNDALKHAVLASLGVAVLAPTEHTGQPQFGQPKNAEH
jgi:hypothetical protein